MTNIATVDEAIRSRRSIRRFLPKSVDKATVTEILELASRSPSGTNAQPWKVYVLAGKERVALSEAILNEYNQGKKEGRAYDYYPEEWVDPWLSRRRKMGITLYELVGIPKGDKARMFEQTGRNYLFFDAPVGIIMTMDKRLGRGMFLDCGVFIGHVILAARARGLDTCVQNAFADYPDTVRRHLGISDGELVTGGIALGYADPDAPENSIKTEREPVEGFASFRGF